MKHNIIRLNPVKYFMLYCITRMELYNLNEIFDRDAIANEIKQHMLEYETRITNIQYKKGIYIYGTPGSGKTEFICRLLKDLNYDMIKYDAGDVRNKSLIDTITTNNVSNRNVLDMFTKKVRKIAIVMDEIDGMNNGDKGGITALIKLIRQKKTKKQRLEHTCSHPIICIGNYYIDKKIKELMKVCNVFELKTPTTVQINNILTRIVPREIITDQQIIEDMLMYIQGDLRKLRFVCKTVKSTPDLLTNGGLIEIFRTKLYDEDSKKITQSLLSTPASFCEHEYYMNETDRTIVALLWHENLIDILSNEDMSLTFPLYCKILQNICVADYIDRITFQKQIWQFNEMSSLIKTFYNNKIYHDTITNPLIKQLPEIRFTKVLTKYSTEYNNMLFIHNLTKQLDMEKKDVISLFQELRLYYGNDFSNNIETLVNVETIFEPYGLSKLDIKRMYRYLDRTVKKDTIITLEDIDEDMD
jgi:DNA polymerase III delta prime subunit